MNDDNLVDLAPHREAKTPHLHGSARCVQCGFEWVVVAPVGVVPWFECPECLSMKGAFIGAVEPESMWACSCGNTLFQLTPDKELICCLCGQHVPSHLFQ